MNDIIFRDVKIKCLDCDFEYIELASVAMLEDGYIMSKANNSIDMEKHTKQTKHNQYDVSFSFF